MPADPLASKHDAGGKVKLPLQPGVRGDAIFMGPSECYRFALMREWGERAPNRHWLKRYVLFIGMNPSTAEATIDDPTIRRELSIVRRLGFERYVKCNVGAYRATNPKDLAAATVALCPPENISTIMAYAAHADRIIAAWGRLPRGLFAAGIEISHRLIADQREVWCLGTNKDGSPKHPLYLAADTPLVRYV